MGKFSLTIQAPQELSQSSYIFTGLFKLQKTEDFDLKIKSWTDLKTGKLFFDDHLNFTISNKLHPKTTVYTLRNTHNCRSVTFAIDLYDHANDFSFHALKNCDFYFKRNYETRFINKLPKDIKAKCLPFGLSFRVGATTWKDNSDLRKGYVLNMLRASFKLDSYLFKRLSKSLKGIQKHLSEHQLNRDISLFENYDLNIDMERVLFQTRCFPDNDNEDANGINEQRYRIIKLLRKEFPKHFNGGFVPSDIVNSKYAEAVTNVPTAPEDYLKFMKQSGIVVYTRGLANSPAWKMAEYLSQGKVIIAEKLTAELPVPLVDGQELLYFNSDEELVSQIQKVLGDKDLAMQLSKNARLYFEKHVHPAENMKRVLNTVK